MPLNIDFQQILLHMLNFVILFAGLGLLLYTPVRRFLNKRRDDIAKKETELAQRAEQQQDILSHAKALEQQAQERAAADCSRMQKEAEEKAAALLQQAKEEAAAIRAKAEQDAKDIRAGALENARSELAELSVKIASAVLEKELDPAAEDALIDDALRAWTSAK